MEFDSGNVAPVIEKDLMNRTRGAGRRRKVPLSSDPVNKIMDRIGPLCVLLGILGGAFLGLQEALGGGLIASILGPQFGLHGTGALVYIMSVFAYGVIGGILGLAFGLVVNFILRILMGGPPEHSQDHLGESTHPASL